MKRTSILICLVLSAIATYSQESSIIINTGYVIADIDNQNGFDQNLNKVYNNGSGWRINATFEELSANGKWANGGSIGYLKTTTYGKENAQDINFNDYSTTTIPVYYAPKFLFGNDQFKGFAKAIAGFHFTYDQPLEKGAFNPAWRNGFLTGAGAGAIYFMKNHKTFLLAEYEWQARYLKGFNSHFAYTHSISVGIGFRLK